MILLSVALWWPGNAIAQNDFPPLPPPFCGELAEADCQLLADSQDWMRYVSSMNMSLTLNSSLAGIPDIADEELIFDMNMAMTMQLDPALNEAMRDIATRSPEELLLSSEEFGALVVDFYETLGMSMDFEMALPWLLIEAIEADEGVLLPETIAMSVRMVDGYAYIDMDKFAEMMPDLRAEMEAEGVTGWIGIDVASQIRQEVNQPGAASDMSAVDSMQASMVFNQLMADETIRALLEPYVTVERLADEMRDGEPVAVFSTSLNLTRMVANPDFTRLLREAADMLIATSGEPVDEQELGMGILGIQMLTNMLARSFEFEVLQVVGVDTPYLYDQDIFLQLDLSGLLALAAMSGEELPEELRGAMPVFTFDMNASYSDFDAAPAVEKPEGAQILPLDSLDQENINLIS